MGVVLAYEDITADSVYEALRKVLEPEAMEHAKQVSFSYRNRPQSPLESAVWWCEHVAATGGLPLAQSYSSELPWYSYHQFDVYIVTITFLVLYHSCWIWLFKRVCCRGVSGFSDEKLKTN